jgi:galactokinase/mevalonate kinase-like predicted kinase
MIDSEVPTKLFRSRRRAITSISSNSIDRLFALSRTSAASSCRVVGPATVGYLWKTGAVDDTESVSLHDEGVTAAVSDWCYWTCCSGFVDGMRGGWIQRC